MSEVVTPTQAPQLRTPTGLASLVRSLLINVLGPYLLYRAVAPHFPHSSTMPLLLSALVPAADLLVGFARRRTIDVIAVLALVQLLISVTITLLAKSASAALIGHALQPGVLGLVFGVSVIAGRPLIEPLARQLMAGGDVERQTRFDSRAKLDGMRRSFARITTVWAVVLCAESAALVEAVHRLPVSDYVLISPIMNYGVYGALVWWSIRYGRRRAALAASTPQSNG